MFIKIVVIFAVLLLGVVCKQEAEAINEAVEKKVELNNQEEENFVVHDEKQKTDDKESDKTPEQNSTDTDSDTCTDEHDCDDLDLDCYDSDEDYDDCDVCDD